MPKQREDLRGRRFGKLVVEKDAADNGTNREVWVICDCGNRKVIQVGSLKHRNTKSCGYLSQGSRERNWQRRMRSLNFGGFPVKKSNG